MREPVPVQRDRQPLPALEQAAELREPALAAELLAQAQPARQRDLRLAPVGLRPVGHRTGQPLEQEAVRPPGQEKLGPELLEQVQQARQRDLRLARVGLRPVGHQTGRLLGQAAARLPGQELPGQEPPGQELPGQEPRGQEPLARAQPERQRDLRQARVKPGPGPEEPQAQVVRLRAAEEDCSLAAVVVAEQGPLA